MVEGLSFSLEENTTPVRHDDTKYDKMRHACYYIKPLAQVCNLEELGAEGRKALLHTSILWKKMAEKK